MDSSLDNDSKKNDFVQKILTDWNFPELVDVFIDNKIDEEVFLTLSTSDLQELIPQLGVRKKFAFKYQQYLLDKAIDVSPIVEETNDVDDVTATDESIISTISITSNNETTTSTNSSNAEEVNPVNFDNLQVKPCYSQKATLGVPFFITQYTTNPGETVRPLLDTTEEGIIIKKSYGAKSKFLRTNLCNLIIKNELQQSKDKRISSERFIQLAKEINDVFIHEAASIYYLPYCKSVNGKIVAARGKLWSTYIHQRQLYKKAGLLNKSTKCGTSQPSSSSANTETDEEQAEISDILIWLKNNAEPFDQVLINWKKTAKTRLNFNNAHQSESIDDYFKRYPALRRQTGYLLLDSDFKYLFPEENNSIFTKWPTFSKIIYGMLKSKKDSYLKELINQETSKDATGPNDDIIEILALKYLPLLLQPPVIKSKTQHWRPSKQELIEGFILFVNVRFVCR